MKFNSFTNGLNFYVTAGIGLNIAHLVTGLRWVFSTVPRAYDSPLSICHPYLAECGDVFSLSSGMAQFIAFIYLVVICISLIFYFLSFCRQNPFLGKIAYSLLFLAFILKVLIFVSRYSFMGNYHTMHFCLGFAYLIAPTSFGLYLLMLTLQYFMAGLLKFNLEWLSGAALLRTPWIESEFYLWALAYAIVLETTLIWGWFFKWKWLQRLTLFQVLAFHGFSWSIVGYFYPVLMFGLLFPVIVTFFVKPESWGGVSTLLKSIKEKPFVLGFGLMVCCSLLVFNIESKFDGDPALDGEIRTMRLNMLDATTKCHVMFILQEKGRNVILTLPPSGRAVRTHCDPVIFQSYLKTYCASLRLGQTLG